MIFTIIYVLKKNYLRKLNNKLEDKMEQKKIDEDTYLALWERFEVKATNREHHDSSTIAMLFEIWVKMKFGRLLE